MEFLAENWLYFASAGLMALIMFKGGGCCGGHSHDTQSHDGSSKAGGCCGGGKHGNQSSENHGHEINQQYNDRLDAAIDPICGMSVNPDTAIKQKIDGKTYYFCSEHCRAKFVKGKKLI
ncbi:YHS domain-containing protein [Clostridium thermopalmarium]|jgi:YHS domain-containing protein|uniref:Copper-transporting P-type ATPase n=1 Tax=Clostridium thermopalmarium DSM 5974 TaxID=1121340 RepID=A0A2T0AMA7_9CLOT|nr:YHS domain-containing protein [Clostridium thermopalmarium]PRR69760.1 Copper-transporting P-type ATPase [Clostridium thermopalmarium DSM 5974]PVZ20950.1 Cu+-exporting ATPase [Clostridium thermopalmarium DSM 5974]